MSETKAGVLGVLRHREVLIEYEGPQLAIWRDAAGGDYLALHLEDDEKGFERWLLVRAGQNRLSLVKSGRLELRKAFTAPETGSGFILSIGSREEAAIEAVDPALLPDEDLPAYDQFLPPATAQARRQSELAGISARSEMPVELRRPAPFWEVSPAAIEYLKSIRTPVEVAAARSGRLIADLILRPGQGRTDVSVPALGSFLTTTQRLVDALAQEDGSGKRGPIKGGVREWTQLDATASFPSSFAVRIETRHGSVDPLTYGRAAFERLLALLSAADERERLIRLTAQLSGRAVAHYRAFAKSIVNSDSGFRAVVGFPHDPAPHEVYLSAEQVIQTYRFLEANVESETSRIELTGKLIALSLKTRFFLIETDEESYSGRVEEHAMPNFVLKKVGAVYRVTLSAIYEVSDVSGEAASKYSLLDLQEVSD